MSDKESVLTLIQNLPPEASFAEILQGIETLILSRKQQIHSQATALRTSTEAAAILTQALTEHQTRKNASEN